MAAPPADSGALDPDSVGRHDFTTTFRGFDQVEVRAFLNKVAAELRSTRARADDLASRLADVEERLHAAEEPDEHRLTAMLGEETARILDAARDAAAEIRTKAEAKTAELVRAAQDDANRMTTEASEVLRTRTAEADEAAATIQGDAESEAARITAEASEAADALRTEAEIEAETLTTTAAAEAQRIVERATEEAEALVAEATTRSEALVAEATAEAERLGTEATAGKEAADEEAAALVEEARRSGREMVAEAQVVRERILTDLARRRKAARAQLEQLRAGRDRLAEAYDVVRRTLDEVSTELSVVVPEARQAAEAAGRRIEAADDDLSAEDIEAELDAARSAGLPLLDTDGGDAAAGTDIEDEVDTDEDDEGSGAEVTDLFARIRAEVPDTEDEVVEDETVDDAGESADEDLDAEAEEAAVEDEDLPETILERRDRRTVPVEKKAARLLKRRLADDENEKLDLIRTMSTKDGPDVVLGDVAEHRGPWLEPVRDLALESVAAGAAFAAEVLAEDDLEPAEADVAVDDLVEEIVDGLLGPIRDKTESLLEGSSGDEALDGVRACYRQWKGRANDVASQLVHTAFNRGVYAAVPDGTEVTWVLDDGAGPCPDGADDALAGAIVKGEEFPTGHLHPPAHAACRCLLVPGGL